MGERNRELAPGSSEPWEPVGNGVVWLSRARAVMGMFLVGTLYSSFWLQRRNPMAVQPAQSHARGAKPLGLFGAAPCRGELGN